MKTFRKTFLIIGMSLFLCLTGCSKQAGMESGSAVKQAGAESGSVTKQAGNGSENSEKQSGNASETSVKPAGIADESADGSAMQGAGTSEEVLASDSEKVWLCTRVAAFYPKNTSNDEILRQYYNDKGYLIKEESYVQGQELSGVSSYGGFLENGKPTWCEREYYEKKKVVKTERIDYVYEDGKLKETRSVTKGTDTFPDQKSVGETICKYDENGTPYLLEWYRNDTLVFSYDIQLEYEYDEEDRPIKLIQQLDEEGQFGTMEYEYDENGNISKEFVRDEGGEIYSTTMYFYDENGNKSRMESYDEKGELYEKMVYKYEQFVIKK